MTGTFTKPAPGAGMDSNSAAECKPAPGAGKHSKEDAKSKPAPGAGIDPPANRVQTRTRCGNAFQGRWQVHRTGDRRVGMHSKEDAKSKPTAALSRRDSCHVGIQSSRSRMLSRSSICGRFHDSPQYRGNSEQQVADGTSEANNVRPMPCVSWLPRAPASLAQRRL